MPIVSDGNGAKFEAQFEWNFWFKLIGTVAATTSLVATALSVALTYYVESEIQRHQEEARGAMSVAVKEWEGQLENRWRSDVRTAILEHTNIGHGLKAEIQGISDNLRKVERKIDRIEVKLGALEED